MLYQKKSFTLPVSDADGSYCKEKGHSATDSRGRCFCCGEKVGLSLAEKAEQFNARRRCFGAHIVGDGYESAPARQ